MLGITLPNVDKIPAVRFDEAKEMVSEKYGRQIRNPYDLEPEEEALIGRYFKEEYGSGFRVRHTLSVQEDDRFTRWMIRQIRTYTLSFDLSVPRT